VKCDSSAVERPGRLRRFPRVQFPSLPLHADRRGNNSSPILQSASTRDLVVNVIASWVDVLRGPRSDDRWHGQANDRYSDQERLHGFGCRLAITLTLP
jgi:hypothetical protein